MGIFDFFKKHQAGDKKEAGVRHGYTDFAGIIGEVMDLEATNGYYWNLKASDSKIFNTHILTLSDSQKVAFILEGLKAIYRDKDSKRIWSSNDADLQKARVWELFVFHLLKMKLELEGEDIVSIYRCFSKLRRNGAETPILQWPVTSLLAHVERQVKEKAMSDTIRAMLVDLEGEISRIGNYYYEKEKIKLIDRIHALLFKADNPEKVKPWLFPNDDEFGSYANAAIESTDERDRKYWYRLLAMVRKTSDSKPTKKFLDQTKEIFKELGVDGFKRMVMDWFGFLCGLKDTYNKEAYNWQLVAPANADAIKGFIWICSHFHDAQMVQTIAAVADRCYKTIPGVGPAAPAIGNACLYTLAHSKGLEGVAHLSWLKLRIKQNNTQTLIGKYLQEAASKEGVSVHEIEDMAVDAYGFEDSKKVYEFDGYMAALQITGIGKTELQWFKPDGTPQKSSPAALKEKHGAALKKIKATAKQAEISLTTQRDRLDRMLRAERKMDSASFHQNYFGHGLMSYIAKRLIWNIEREGKTEPFIYYDGGWINPANRVGVAAVDTNAKFSLWHPVQGGIMEVTAWRDLILELHIIQPLKQAFREVYLLTDAELNTRIYSNRMAAHILKQHQFNSLAKTRGWKYSLLGAYDSGRSYESASIVLPDCGLRAEYWVNEVNADNALKDTGIWLYVATDQVRFLREDSGEVIPLVDVPPIALSEVMRDVDLFVGVASVGNDPAWRDSGGLPAYRDYWQGYSFGELSEVAKTRKQILERLLPRLKFARVAEIRDRFLVVKGKLRTYKIHLGSTNILMEPNDQYLCIVPDRSQKASGENVFLPFEGDNGLSIIISKAFLLADDEKITDETITRQIKIK